MADSKVRWHLWNGARRQRRPQMLRTAAAAQTQLSRSPCGFANNTNNRTCGRAKSFEYYRWPFRLIYLWFHSTYFLMITEFHKWLAVSENSSREAVAARLSTRLGLHLRALRCWVWWDQQVPRPAISLGRRTLLVPDSPWEPRAEPLKPRENKLVYFSEKGQGKLRKVRQDHSQRQAGQKRRVSVFHW